MTTLGVVLSQYEAEIKSFSEALNRIDSEYGTHVKLSIEDFQPRPMSVMGIEDKPIQHYRMITIDGVMLQGEPDGTNGAE